jgi:Zn-dependent protease with chaperone function
VTVVLVCFSYLFTVGLALACVYIPWLLVTNDIGVNTVALFVAGVLVAGVMLWALIPRRDSFEPPGVRLDHAVHHALFAELQTIAGTLGEPVPEVYLIGDSNAWVAERGGRLGFGTRRIMGIGLPLLGALNVSELRAVLAHEFAHYYDGDTSLGPWLRRTQMAMIRTLQSMESIAKLRLHALVTAVFAVVGGILESYWRVFLRAIKFMSRKQEFRADELACLIAGSASLVGGLRRTQAAAAVWPTFWNNAAAPLLSSGCLPPLARSFSQFLIKPDIAQQVETGIENQLQSAELQPYDSHPPLRDRIAAARTMTVLAVPEDSRPAWSLLNNLEEAEFALLSAMNPSLSSDALTRVSSWEEAAQTVLIQKWARTIAAHADLLRGITAGNLATSADKLADIAARLPNPDGMLLSRQERVPHALHLLATAFTIALVNNGWTVHSSVGEFYLKRGDERLQPFQLIFQLFNGTLARDAWSRICEQHAIAHIQFVPLSV